MSRFSTLKKYLGFKEALAVYIKLKTKKLERVKVNNLKHFFKMRNNPYDYATFEEVILQQTYNIPLNFLPKNIIDGGGNIGLTACFFATKFTGATIVSVEPDDDNFNILNDNIKPYSNISAIKAGIWNKSAYLKITNTTAGNNAFTIEETLSPETGTLKALSITDIMAKMKWDYIDILKLDIEGSEKEVFSDDFENWLPKTKVIVIELHDAMKPGCSRAVFAAVNKYNFSFNFKGENIIFTNLSFEN
ncbi:MAG: FkbM family methyltransferase [Ferruginibacter sp.]